MLKFPSNPSTAPLAAATEPVLVTTKEQADEATLAFARERQTCERLQSEFNEAVVRLYTTFYAEYAPHEQRATLLEEAVVAFARRTLDELNASRSRPIRTFVVAYGRVKLSRESDRVVVKVSREQLITNLRKCRLGRLIQSREFVEAGDLRTIKPALHARIGFAIEPTPDSGSIELDRQSLSPLIAASA
jgi:hypothetical protein